MRKITHFCRQLLFLVLVTTSGDIRGRGGEDLAVFAKPKEQKQFVSLISLIADGQKWHGRTVIVQGILSLGSEHSNVFLSGEALREWVWKNSVGVQFNESLRSDEKVRQLNRKWVILEGVYNATNNGHMGLASGTIERVSQIQRNPSR